MASFFTIIRSRPFDTESGEICRASMSPTRIGQSFQIGAYAARSAMDELVMSRESIDLILSMSSYVADDLFTLRLKAV